MNYIVPNNQAAIAPTPEDDDEIVWGAERIGEVIGRTSRQANYLMATGKIPATKIGSLWAARRSTLKSIVP
jgi:hypothetical protein